MLKLKPNCENCNKNLKANSTEAMICSFECTFCRDCVETVLDNVCPNCGGGFCPRPIRPVKEYISGVSLKQYPASTSPVLKLVDTEKQKKLIEQIGDIAPAER